MVGWIMEKSPQEIRNLAKLMYDRKELEKDPLILLLGAGASISSGCSSNDQIIEEVVKDFSNSQNLTWEGKITEFYQILKKYKPDTNVIMDKHIAGKGISPGYIYLSKLIRDGYFNIVFTTNFDSLLEDALGNIMKMREFKIVIRDEIKNTRIEEILKFEAPRVKIVKLHGDLNARIFYIKSIETSDFPEGLEYVLRKYFDQDIIIVGHRVKDLDIAKCIRNNTRGTIWYVNPNAPSSQESFNQAISARPHNIISGKNGEFDEFFFNLHYEINKLRLERFDKELNEKIPEELERGDSYLHSDKTRMAIRDLAFKINDTFPPDLVIVIRDPDVPGGPALWERIKDHISDAEKDEIVIEGRKEKREVNNEKLPEKNYEGERQKILILDSISLSGNTIEIAYKKIKERNYKAEIKMALLVVSKRLIEASKSGEMTFGHDDLIYARVTNRPEMFFPWGWIQATGNWERLFESIVGKEYAVRWIKKPWGNQEVFAENERCSVKMHTVEAGESLSLHRHLYRDEFFVPLDENIGIQIGNKTIVVEKGDYILIPRGTWHRFYAYKERGRVLEVAFGWYDQERDIERRKDKYGRK